MPPGQNIPRIQFEWAQSSSGPGMRYARMSAADSAASSRALEGGPKPKRVQLLLHLT